MCGIAGMIFTDLPDSDPEAIASRMQRQLLHRGPDDRGLFVSSDRRCALVHTRLAIIDLSAAGHQPMRSEDGRYTLILNGEIYNFAALRRELELSGIALRSRSDTEVVLRLFARDGVACLARLRGMFALCLWDEREQELTLVRDRFGIKPLYFHAGEKHFLCASEVRALLASGLIARKLSQAGLAAYLACGSLADPLTMVAGIQALLPGHYLTARRRGDRIEIADAAYADSGAAKPAAAPPTERAEAVTQLRRTLEDSVRSHLVSDVPVGVFLSGGIDSSAIVALMQRIGTPTPRTFSVAFADRDFSEAEHARAIAQRFATEHREILLAEKQLCELIPAALEAMDQPTMDGVNTFVIAKAVRESGATVALSGLGGDELFAGYPSFRRARQLRRLAALPPALRNGAAGVGRGMFGNSSRRRKICRLLASDCSAQAAYTISRELFSPAEIAGFAPALDGHSQTVQTDDGGDPINAMSRYELSGYMANTLLRDTDQMSMAHGLEVRVPFVDSAVADYVLSLPGAWKLNGQRPKPLLLDALAGLIPESIWRRPKMGFTLPFQRWLTSALRPEVESTLDRADGITAQGLDRRAVRTIWRAFLNNPQGEPWSRPWSLYVLERWCALNQIEA